MAEPFCFACKLKSKVGDSANVISILWCYKYELYRVDKNHLIPRIDNSKLFNHNGKLLRSLANNLNYYILCNMCLDIFVSKYQIDPKHPIIPKGIIIYDNSLRRACLELYPIELIVKLHINDMLVEQRTIKISKHDVLAKFMSLAKQEFNFSSEKFLISIKNSTHSICSDSKSINQSLSELNVVNGSTVYINCNSENFKYNNTTVQESSVSTSFPLSSANHHVKRTEHNTLNHNNTLTESLICAGKKQIEPLAHRNSVNNTEFTPKSSENQERTDHSCYTTSTSNSNINNPLNDDILAKPTQYDLQVPDIPESTLSNNIYKQSAVHTANTTLTTAKIYQTKPIKYFLKLIKTDKINYNPSILYNIGNSCYMNCGLQCVAHIPEIIRYFIEGEYSASINYDNPLGMKGRLVESFAELIKYIWDSTNSTLKSRNYKQLIEKYDYTLPDFLPNAVEHLVCMLDALHEETKQKTEDTLCADVNGYSSIISRTFYGKLESSITYDACQHTSSQVEDFAILSLSIVKPKSHKQSSTTSGTNIASNNACDTSKWFTIKYIDVESNSYKELSHIISPMSLVKSYLLLDWRAELVYLVYNNRRILKVWRNPGNTEHVINVIRPDGLHYYKFEIESPSKIKKHLLEMRCFFNDLERANLIICQVGKGKFVKILNEKFKSNDIPFDHRVVVYDMGTTSADKCVLIENVVSNYNTNPPETIYFGIPFVIDSQLVNNSINNLYQIINDRMKSLINIEYIKNISENTANMNISVQQNAATPSLDRTNITLNDCIADYVCERIIEDKSSITCQECNASSTKFRKKITLYSLPRVLIIQLKRFQRRSHSRSNYSSFEKSHELVEYPNRLQLEERGNDNSNNEVEYELRAVINHYGTMRGGDYDAIVKQFIDDNWYEYNFIANTARQISSNNVSDSAYVLLYYKCD